MKYIATKTYTVKNGFIEITKEEYLNLKNARDSLFNYMHLETVFDYVVENYNEYEEEMLKLSSQILLFHHHDYFKMNRFRDLISRRLISLLTACQMYKDQKPKYVNKIFSKKSKLVQKIISYDKKYIDNFAVETINFLRDYVQHQGFPIQNLLFSHEGIDRKEENQLRTQLIPKIDLKQLEKDRKLDRNLYNELNAKSKNNQVNLSPIIKEYIQIIGVSHENFRKIVAEKITDWKTLIFNTLEKVGEIYENIEKSGASIAIVDSNDLWSEHFTIFKEFTDRIAYFERKNRLFNNLVDRYSSNEIDEKNT